MAGSKGREERAAAEEALVAGRYVRSDRWSVRYENELLILSAGADELYAIDDCAPETAAEVAAAWKQTTIESETLSAAAAELLDRLGARGIVEPEGADAARSHVALECAGHRNVELEHAFATALDASSLLERAAGAPSDFTVVVRTNARLADLYESSPAWSRRPHLLLDVAYHHTVSLGPLVFPGDTACLGCLAGRIGHYWGDAPPPRAPAVQRHDTFLASLLIVELEKIASGDVGLINATVAWDLRAWEIARHAVYKLPWCPHCGEADPEPLGSIDLPWIRAA